MKTVVVGCGHWGPHHVRVMAALRGADNVVAVDERHERLVSVVRAVPGIRTEPELGAALGDPHVDSVVVVTPTSTHVDVVTQALQAGKHVLCEKPLCTTVEEARQMGSLARASGVRLAVGFVFLYNAGLHVVKNLVRRGDVGDVQYLAAVRTNPGPIRADVNVAYDLAAHDISIFNWLLESAPICVSAVGGAFLQSGVEDVAFISLTYPGLVKANIHVSWLTPRKVRQIAVVGSAGMTTWDDLNLNAPVAIYDKANAPLDDGADYSRFLRAAMVRKDVRLPQVPVTEPLMEQDAAFLRSLTADEPGLPDAAFGTEVTRVLEAIRRSLKDGGLPVAIAEVR